MDWSSTMASPGRVAGAARNGVRHRRARPRVDDRGGTSNVLRGPACAFSGRCLRSRSRRAKPVVAVAARRGGGGLGRKGGSSGACFLGAASQRRAANSRLAVCVGVVVGSFGFRREGQRRTAPSTDTGAPTAQYR